MQSFQKVPKYDLISYLFIFASIALLTIYSGF